MQTAEVPSQGPLVLGAIYQRSALHARFGGNNTTGIVPSRKEPAILLFHTEEGAHQFYGDGLDDEGVYWYSGMGAKGNMEWNYANRAVRDHLANGQDLMLFERFQRQGGYWTFAHLMHCVGWREEQRPDSDGAMRTALIFGLVAVDESAHASLPNPHARLTDLRQAAIASVPTGGTVTATRVTEVYLRSAAIRVYVLARAAGVCEACLQPAPFMLANGEPFLEAHHIDRLSDGGPDHPERVGGVCPNCHRRCHYGADAAVYNKVLREAVSLKEAKLSALATRV
jgi:5-methylcytosine-specific restriction protein A